ncbi:flagellar hook basal-body protein [bacterium]|nr:flagellar hook basal-body protein [bacterium]
MFGALVSGISGIYSSVFRHRTSSANIANVNTSGYQALEARSSVSESGSISNSVTLSRAQGAFIPTNHPLDIAIEGGGYFKVINSDGNIAFTRAGNLRPDPDGYLADPDGFRLSPPVEVDSSTGSVTVDADGAVWGKNSETGQILRLGNIHLFKFPNPSGLEPIGGGKYAITEASGAPTWDKPGASGLGALRSRGLEASNVNIINEMIDQTLASRSVEANVKTIQTADEMLGTVLDIVE